MEDNNTETDGLIQKVQDVAGGLVGRAGAAMTTTARSFVDSAAISDLYEVASGELALERASSDEVRSAARMMVDEHRETTRRLRGLVGRDPDLVPPSTMDARRHGMIEHLIQAADFDRTYLDQQVLAHQEAVTLMHSYRDGGDDEALRSFAAEVAPIVERHLAHMKEMRARIAPA
jgi:putative membrane protein